MKYFEYSRSQLEEKANDLIRQTNAKRFKAPEEIDVYDIVDFLGCTPDWLYLTPVGKILGMTAFSDFIWLAWPASHFEEGMVPHQVYINTGTILIDESLLDNGDKAKERFTVIHECFHWILHQKCYKRRLREYSSVCTASMIRNTGKKPMTAMEINEWQANYCAACFLMPKAAVENTFSLILGESVVPRAFLDPENRRVKFAIFNFR